VLAVGVVGLGAATAADEDPLLGEQVRGGEGREARHDETFGEVAGGAVHDEDGGAGARGRAQGVAHVRLQLDGGSDDARAYATGVTGTTPWVHRLGLGLAAVGRPAYITLGRDEDLASSRSVADLEARSHLLLDRAYDLGVRYLDAARSYGHAERFLGSWLAARPGRREQLTVGSKWGYEYVGGWALDAPLHERKDHRPQVLDRQWPQTLEALGGPPDVYLVHSVTPDSPALGDEELLDRLRALAATGVRVGLSTSGPAQGPVLDRALALPGNPFSAVQSTWNLLERSVGPALERAHDAGWLVVVKEGVANGRLTARGDEPAVARLAALDGQTPDAYALGAVLAQPFVDVVLSGAVTVAQLEQNLAARPPAAVPDEVVEEPAAYWAHRSGLRWA
jgi:aryl-alcohol dehydrogenase-like predicted oxidoreductase